MNKMNGWNVYLKIKELSNSTDSDSLHISHIADALSMKEELVREYLVALATLEFIKFTDHSKELFVLTDLGRL